MPKHYVVDLQPVLTERAPDYYTFNGSSSVTFMVEKSTPYVIIHSNKLNYSDDAVEVTQGVSASWLFVGEIWSKMDLSLRLQANFKLRSPFLAEIELIHLQHQVKSKFQKKINKSQFLFQSNKYLFTILILSVMTN